MEDSRGRSHLSAKIRKAANQHPEEKNYWLDKLSGDLVKTSFPVDCPEPGLEKGTKSREFRFNREVFSRLKELDKGNDYILHVYMAASLVVLLSGYTGNTDIIISTAIYRQDTHEELINTILPLRIQLTVDMTFKQLLRQLKETIATAEENQNYPIELVVEQLNLSSVPGNDFPLLDTAVLVESIHDPVYLKRIRHNITFSFTRKQEYLEAEVNYNCQLYRDSTIQRIMNQFQQLLAEALRDLDSRLCDIDILPPQEKEQLLHEFNNTAVEYPAHKTLHGLFADQAAQTPDQVALKGILETHKNNHNMTHLTYRELNQKSDQLAYLLQERGVQTDTIVGLMVERSLEMILGLLGILKAGGAYLPIDPEYPQERILYMLADSGARVLVSKLSKLSEVSEVSGGIEIIDLHQIKSKGDFPTHLTQLNLAYVIYTSGTTGRPKGVMIAHRSVINFIKGMTDVIEFRPYDRILSLTTICFDIFGLETFVPLTQGSTVLIGTREQQLDPAAAAWVMRRERVTIFQVTPSRLQLFLLLREAGESLAALDYLLVGGEAFPESLLKKTRTLLKGKILNLYGPTETTIWSAVKDLTGEVPLNIGKPIANTQIYILDNRLKLVPIGAPGEIYIGGHGVARGYLNNPELTAAKFDRDLWDYQDYHDREAPGKKDYKSYKSYMSYIYKTGDLGRWLPEGNIEFLGRVDHQLKIRGYRIELGEIENHLLKHESIKEAVVIDKEDAAGHKYLCAYYVSNSPGNHPGTAELREYHTASLPDYMIPSYFIRLERIPLSPSGKIDRKALPDPEIKIGQQYIAPGNRLEEQLEDIWCRLLGAKKGVIGIHDNFFRIGGHSLNATIMATKIYETFNILISLVEIFKTPTIRAIASLIKVSGKANKQVDYTSIEPMEEQEYYVLSPAQKRLYLVQQMEPNNISYNMSYVLPLAEVINKEKLAGIFKKLINRHESLRTYFITIDGEPFQRINDEVELVIGHWSLVIGEEDSSEAILKDFVRPFDLSQAPLIRVGLVKLLETPTALRSHRRPGTHSSREGKENKYLLMVDMHHIAADGTSQNILKEEFIELYHNKPLPGLRLYCRDYCQWLSQPDRQERIKQQETFWLQVFSGEWEDLNLPLDFTRPQVQSFEGSSVSFVIGPEETHGLREISGEAGATLYMTLLSIVSILLARLSRQEDIIVGTPVAARRHPDLQRVIGMFVNTLVMRNFPSGDKPFRSFLKEVKGQSICALENQEYPFENLVDKVLTRRDTSRNPLFDVMFNLLNQVDYPQDIPAAGQENQGYGVYTKQTSKFDLNFTAVDLGKEIFFDLEYCSRLFKECTVQRIINYFKQIIRCVSGEREVKLSGIEIIPAEEKEQLLKEFNNTKTGFPNDKTIHQLFEEQVEQNLDNIAVIVPPRKENRTYTTYISYRELNQKSNQLAVLLRDKGVAANTIVGIMTERSMEMIIGLIGILKAGGAYLPIDPGYPEQRIKYMLKDSASKILVTTKDLSKKIAFANEIIFLADAINRAPTPPHLRLSSAPATSLAYVIYTSGSTGKPKGVLLEHINLVNLLIWNFTHSDMDFSSVLQFATICFDASFHEIFAALLSAGKLCLIHERTRTDIPGLFNVIRNYMIRTLFLPMAVLKIIFTEEDYIKTFPACVGHIQTAGEQVVINDRLRNFLKENKVVLHNHYGPSETHVVTAFTLAPGDIPALPPIGKPVSNTTIYILDRWDNIQPVGVPGELYIGGIQVGRGYLNRPELTAERFRAPLNRSYKSYMSYILYRTGDLARWRPEGNIDFLGRVDFQVKIRGIRIEPGEIENRLLMKEEINNVVVLVKETPAGDKYLCAYIVSDSELKTPELKAYLSTDLPDYMIPSYFIRVERIPLTPNGKIDRNSLPNPELKANETYTAPRNRVEELLEDIWCQLLGVKKGVIGIDRNFFELGGHSLKASIMAAKIYETFGATVSLAEIFKTPTIRAIAALIKVVDWVNVQKENIDQESEVIII